MVVAISSQFLISQEIVDAIVVSEPLKTLMPESRESVNKCSRCSHNYSEKRPKNFDVVAEIAVTNQFLKACQQVKTLHHLLRHVIHNTQLKSTKKEKRKGTWTVFSEVHGVKPVTLHHGAPVWKNKERPIIWKGGLM